MLSQLFQHHSLGQSRFWLYHIDELPPRFLDPLSTFLWWDEFPGNSCELYMASHQWEEGVVTTHPNLSVKEWNGNSFSNKRFPEYKDSAYGLMDTY